MIFLAVGFVKLFPLSYHYSTFDVWLLSPSTACGDVSPSSEETQHRLVQSVPSCRTLKNCWRGGIENEDDKRCPYECPPTKF